MKPVTAPIRLPAICIWLKLYCLVMILLLGAVVALALVMIFNPRVLLEGETAYMRNPEGASALLAVFGVFFGVIFGAPLLPLFAFLVWPRRPAAWYVGFVAIVAGFFTSVGWIATAPLLIFWLRPNVKAYYGIHPKQHKP